jgi:hypothetical protein
VPREVVEAVTVEPIGRGGIRQEARVGVGVPLKKETAAEAAALKQWFEASGLEVYRRLFAALGLDFVVDLLAIAFEAEDHLVDRRRSDAEVPLHVGFGWGLTEHALIHGSSGPFSKAPPATSRR